jgi:glycosyltransferase involved in cell wall biosynthesis
MGGRIDIRLIANEGPRGPSAARNTAIRQSEAEWIALLDADDLLAPGHHEALLAVVAGAGNTVLGFGDNTVFRSGSMSSPSVGSYFDSGGLSRLPALERQPGCWSLQDGLFSALLAHGVFGTSACLVQRRASVAAGLFDESMMQSEDTDFFMRLALQGEALFTRTIVAHKRLHDSNLSHERHKLRFCRGTSLSLVKLEAAASSLLLTDQQVCALGGAATASIDGYLYHASLAGWPAYREAAMLAFRTGRGRIATDPRHLARLVLRRWRA